MTSELTVSLAALASVTFLTLAPAAFADETTVTTTTTRTDPPAAVVTVPAHPADTTIVDEPSCTKEKTTKTDEDTGDTVTKTRTTCD